MKSRQIKMDELHSYTEQIFYICLYCTNILGNKVNRSVFGIHHVTAITSNPQQNIDFYVNNLGLRFVKLTVNQDDPTSYHLYYGDELGRPGTILTFFHWPDAPKEH